MAQLGARLDGIEEVGGSNPPGSTKYHVDNLELLFGFNFDDINLLGKTKLFSQREGGYHKSSRPCMRHLN